MKKRLALRTERLVELTPAELDEVVGASGATCTHPGPTLEGTDLNRCVTLLCV